MLELIETSPSKRLAIMQPYLFPYFGYFQLIAATDLFIFLDDAQYIKRGWINRNKINTSNNSIYFTIPVKKHKQEEKIHNIHSVDATTWRKYFLNLLEKNYSKKKYHTDFLDFISKKFLLYEKENLCISQIAIDSICLTTEYLDIEFKYIKSSDLAISAPLRGVDRIISIAQKNNANSYINLPGGKKIYSSRNFTENSINLFFIDTDHTLESIPKLSPAASIIDTIMRIGKQETREIIMDYRLSTG